MLATVASFTASAASAQQLLGTATGVNSAQIERVANVENGTSGPGGLPTLSVRDFTDLGLAEPFGFATVSFDTAGVVPPETNVDAVDLVLDVSSFTSGTVGLRVASYALSDADLRFGPLFRPAPSRLTDQGRFPITGLGPATLRLQNPGALAAAGPDLGLLIFGDGVTNVQFAGTAPFGPNSAPPQLQFRAIPEPATAALLVVGGLAALRRGRRRVR